MTTTGSNAQTAIVEEFQRMDVDGDGGVDRADFLCMPAAEAATCFTTLDSDGDGQLSDREFLKAVKRFSTS
ncbi:EF-hand domain-containing protein [Streptomyces sirii]|uniref:EF-hand domain-containing protein n=1 Tax=Streptomyces sirii TaxID=3127701 RepID=UPI003D35D91B